MRRFRLLQRVRPALLADAVKGVLRVKRIPVAVNGIQLLVDPCSHFGLKVLVDGCYEPEMCQVFTSILRPGSTCVDVGANEGYFSMLAASIVGPAGRVLAIEPQPRMADSIRTHIALNDAANVEFVPLALSDSDGSQMLYVSPSLNSGSSGFTRTTWYPLRQTKVQVSTLGRVLSQCTVETVDLLKVDVEGHEYEVILGAKEVFAAARVRYIALELHPTILRQRGLDAAEITAFLEQCGYRPDPRFSGLVYAAP